MVSRRKSTVKLVARRGQMAYRYSRFSKRANKMKTSYVVTTPGRRISKLRLGLIRHSRSLKKILGKRRRYQLRHPRRISAARKAMHARESRLLWGSPSARRHRSRRNRSRRSAHRVARSPARRLVIAAAAAASSPLSGIALVNAWKRARCAGVAAPCNNKTKGKWLMNWAAYKAQHSS